MRSRRPSLRSTSATCDFTVSAEMVRESAISAFDRPLASSSRTSRSRGLRAAAYAGSAGGGPCPAGEVRHEAAADRRPEQHRPVGDEPDAVDQPGGGDVLEQEAAGAGPDGVVHVGVEVEGGQHEHLGEVGVAADQPGGLDAVQVGHAHVHEGDVRCLCRHQVHQLAPVVRRPDHRHVGLRVDQRREPGADHRLVVGDHDADHGRPRGSVASTTNSSPDCSCGQPAAQCLDPLPHAGQAVPRSGGDTRLREA